MGTLTHTVAPTPIQYSLSKAHLDLYSKSLHYDDEPNANHGLNTTCMHPNLHLSKFPPFTLKVTESIDRNIHLDWLNHIHSLVIIF